MHIRHRVKRGASGLDHSPLKLLRSVLKTLVLVSHSAQSIWDRGRLAL